MDTSDLLDGFVREAPFGAALWERDGDDFVLRVANARASALVGIDFDAHRGRRLSAWPRRALRGVVDAFARVLATGATELLPDSVIAPSDDTPLRVLTTRVFRVSPAHVGVAFDDVTASRRAEAERSVATLGSVDLYEHAPVGLHSLDADGVFVRINQTALSWLGYTREEVVDRLAFPEVLTPASRALFAERFPVFKRDGVINDAEFELLCRDGSVRPVLLSSAAVRDADGAFVTSRSAMVELRGRRGAGSTSGADGERHAADALVARAAAEAALARTEAQLRHAQKMEAVARLAGGVAHDFNNLLTAISSFTVFALDGLDESDPRRADLEQVRLATERATSLTRQLLLLSRDRPEVRERLRVDGVITELARLLERLIGEDVRIALRLNAAEVWTEIERTHVEQIVLNLAVNARDAMPRGGVLTIETCRLELDAEASRAHYGVAPGSYLHLAVSDTGIGMDRDTLARAFEPFFTTKPAGVGTGLGLSTVYGVVKQNAGHIWAYSEPGLGTTFHVILPEHAAEDAPSRPSQPTAIPARRSRGNEVVLLVEDDALVRAAARGILERLGFVVLAAATPSAALEQLAHTPRLDLVLTDVVMPEMSGPEFVRELHAQRPGVPVLFMSGYTDGALSEQRALEPGVSFVRKPLTPDMLARAIATALAGPAAAPPHTNG